MEPERSLPHPHKPATCPYPQPDQSSLCPPNPLLLMITGNDRRLDKTVWEAPSSALHRHCNDDKTGGREVRWARSTREKRNC